MSSIFHRLDELERVQREILVQLNGTEIPESDENARSATHSHEMHPNVTNNDTLVDRVMVAYQDGCISDVGSGFYNHYAGARAAILEVICSLEGEKWFGVANWLRSQVEP